MPTTWAVSDGYRFEEANSIEYDLGISGPGNSFNGITISDTDLFTYDSYKLKKWSSTTGAEINSIVVNSTNIDSVMFWAGLTSDECDDIFLGSNSIIEQYDGNLKLKDTLHEPDSIYALNLGKNNILYACGAGFVSAIQVKIPSCGVINVSKNIVNATCSSEGSVTVVPSGGSPPYNIVWNTDPPQTGPTATNLTLGTYIATITDNSCSGEVTAYDTVNINTTSTDAMVIPSAFTPGKNGVNAVYLPNFLCNGVESYEFRVFDRWGRMVFETTSPGQGWDGKFNGQLQPLDVYVYYIKFSCGTCNIFKKGNVTLVR